MRVLIATQVYPPEQAPTAVMVRELAEYLASHGNAVTVAAGHPHHPSGRLPRGWPRPLLSRESAGQVTVLRGWHPVSPRRSVVARGLVMASQALGVAGASLIAERPDVVLTFGLPLIGPLLSLAVARRFRAPAVTVVSDVYPDVAIETRKLTNHVLITVARAAELMMYRYSDRLVVLSEGFHRTVVSRGADPDKVTVIPVWLDDPNVQPLVDSALWRKRTGISMSQRVVLYAGTIGLVHGLEVLLAASRLLDQEGLQVSVVIVGEGNAKAALQEAAAGLRNVTFLPFQEQEHVSKMMASADLCFVSLAPGAGKSSVPSKAIAYMAAGKPLIASVDPDSDTAIMLQQSGAGWVTPAGDAAALAKAIERALSAPDERKDRGRSARSWFVAGWYLRSTRKRS